MIWIDVLFLVVGFIALIKGADWFVDGSSALAKNFKVPGVIVGLTIVALGTSAPELAVSTSAALQGSNEIALSNVVGSNIFNLLCVLGVCAFIHTIPVDDGILRRDFPISIATTVLVLLLTSFGAVSTGSFLKGNMADTAGTVSRATGAVLLIVFVAYIAYLIYDARKNPDKEEAGELLPIWKCLLLILIGLALIIAGGQAVVYSAKEIARTMGMTETLIGLTVVALGTSLPELVTSIVAARKGETGLAVGNVVGSNIFNLLFILGISSTIHPIAVNTASVYDMIILIIVSIITYAFAVKGKSIRRAEGVWMVLIYAADMVFAVMR
ncbi:MAG: calcium/sodium antiporter [Lachnospiraceae bacterium]|nr:calcium/sodium antiporter [Lachnospiraceae bacterium]